MAVNAQLDTTLTLTVDGTAYSGNIIDGAITPASTSRGRIVTTADGSTIRDIGDAEDGTIRGSCYKDTTATGITRGLQAAEGTTVAYIYAETDGTTTSTWSGNCYVPAQTIDFTPGKYGRHQFELVLETSSVAYT